ncbi:hypothetical protein A8926_6048 [Saccharopolyspora spinosa]|uniref:Uncharacterized protein n=1 Tax=Saccharopolyspora spinosa TaxID=60894 RepID=A0A2N3Y580_SACSN|nr:hypothetical protein A8926_6048 [Saccharopolyspora spinosa]
MTAGAGGDRRCEDVHRVRLGGENPQVPLKSNLRFQWNLRTVGVSHPDTPMPVDNLRNFNGNRGRVRTCQDPQPGRSLFRAETCEPDMALAPTERHSRRYRKRSTTWEPATHLGNLPPTWATCHPPGQPATHLPARNYLNRIGQPCTRPGVRGLADRSAHRTAAGPTPGPRARPAFSDCVACDIADRFWPGGFGRRLCPPSPLRNCGLSADCCGDPRQLMSEALPLNGLVETSHTA